MLPIEMLWMRTLNNMRRQLEVEVSERWAISPVTYNVAEGGSGRHDCGEKTSLQ